MANNRNKQNGNKITCEYHYSAYIQKGILVNSGYNCSHSDQVEVVEIDGQTVGCCYPWSCPLNDYKRNENTG